MGNNNLDFYHLNKSNNFELLKLKLYSFIADRIKNIDDDRIKKNIKKFLNLQSDRLLQLFIDSATEIDYRVKNGEGSDRFKHLSERKFKNFILSIYGAFLHFHKKSGNINRNEKLEVAIESLLNLHIDEDSPLHLIERETGTEKKFKIFLSYLTGIFTKYNLDGRILDHMRNEIKHKEINLYDIVNTIFSKKIFELFKREKFNGKIFKMTKKLNEHIEKKSSRKIIENEICNILIAIDRKNNSIQYDIYQLRRLGEKIIFSNKIKKERVKERLRTILSSFIMKKKLKDGIFCELYDKIDESENITEIVFETILNIKNYYTYLIFQLKKYV